MDRIFSKKRRLLDQVSFAAKDDQQAVSVSSPPPTLPGLVKAVNTAVDLIVAHFSTSRDADVKVGVPLHPFDDDY